MVLIICSEGGRCEIGTSIGEHCMLGHAGVWTHRRYYWVQVRVIANNLAFFSLRSSACR
jgi:hypothetical protein